MFNDNDIVLCINNENVENRLTVGKTYKVISKYRSNNIYVLNDKDTIDFYGVSRFELVIENSDKKEKISELKKVKFIPETDFEFVEMDGVRGILITEKD